MQAQLPGSLEPEPESAPEPGPAADLKQELHGLARLFMALRHGASPSLIMDELLDAAEHSKGSYMPCSWMLSPSGLAAALVWVRPPHLLLSSSSSESSPVSWESDAYVAELGIQMVVLGASGIWETAATAGAPGLLEAPAGAGKCWSPSGRYFVTAHASDDRRAERGVRTQIFDTAAGWLPEYYIGEDPEDLSAGVPLRGQACFSDDESLAAAVVMDMGLDHRIQVAIFGVHQRCMRLVPVGDLGCLGLVWLPGTSTLIIYCDRHDPQLCKLGSVSSFSSGLSPAAELEVEWCVAGPAFPREARLGHSTHHGLTALQPAMGRHTVVLLHCHAISGDKVAFQLSLYDALALSSGPLCCVSGSSHNDDDNMGTISAEVSLHASARSVAACLGDMHGSWVYQLGSCGELGSCLFHKPGLHRLSFAHGGRFVVGILRDLAVVVCGLTGTMFLQIDVQLFCHELEPLAAIQAALVQDRLQITACTPAFVDDRFKVLKCDRVHLCYMQL